MCSDINTDIFAGVTKGTYQYSEDKIKQLVNRFKNGNLAFIQDQDTIDLIKKQLDSGEWNYCKPYLKDTRLKMLVKMGLTLRELDKNKEQKKILDLKNKISLKFGSKSVHIAQIVQNKILTSFIGYLAKTEKTLSEMMEYIEILLNNSDNFVIFVKNLDFAKEILATIVIKIRATNLPFLIIFSCGTAIKQTLILKSELAKTKLINDNYNIEVQEELNEGIRKYIIFITKKDEISIS